MSSATITTSKFNTPQLLAAYESAVDLNIISSITDTRGEIVYVNRKFCETSKYDEWELIGQNHRIVNSGYHSKEFFRDMWSALGRGEAWHDEIRNRAKDGTFYWVDTVIVPVRDAAGKTTHFLSLRTLITERKALDGIQSNHLSSLQALLVMTSQKTSKPMAACLKQLDLMEAGERVSEKEQASMVTTLRASVAELEAFTRELTDFIRDMEV